MDLPECKLLTSSYEFGLSCDPAKRRERGWVDVTFRLHLLPGFTATLSAEATNWLSADDLLRMAAYLDGYISKVIEIPEGKIEVFPYVPLNLTCELMAGDGDQLSEDEGDFTLTTRLNVGLDADGRSVYVGAMGVITFSRARDFARDIRRLAEIAGRSPGQIMPGCIQGK